MTTSRGCHATAPSGHAGASAAGGKEMDRHMDHDHLPALSALLFSAPLVVLALAGVQVAAGRGSARARLALDRAAATPVAGKLVALAVGAAGAIHLGLPFGHLEEPVLAASFAAAGVAMAGLAVSALLRLPHWRPLAAATLAGVLAAYSASRLAGLEGVDALGVATAALELVALGLVVSPRTQGPASATVRA